MDSLEKLEAQLNFKREYSKNINQLNLKDPEARYNLYFSKPYKGILNAEVVDNQDNINNHHGFLTRFATTWFYTFSFNDKGEIISVAFSAFDGH